MIQENFSNELKRIKKYSSFISFVWIIIISASLFWNLFSIIEQSEEIAKANARTHLEKDSAFRIWLFENSNVCQQDRKDILTNQNIDGIPDCETQLDSTDSLTLMNSTCIFLQLQNRYTETYHISSNITSLKPLNEKNNPDEWEQKALVEFEKGIEEVYEFRRINGEKHLRLIQPLITKESCISCHELQGYKVGDVLGGISISVPLKPICIISNSNRSRIIAIHIALMLFGFIGIKTTGNRFSKKIIENEKVKERLREKDERLKLAHQASNAGVWDWNIKTREATFDERWAEISGYTLEELIPINIETWNKLVHPDDLDELDILLQKHYALEHYEYESRMKHKNGKWIWVQIRGKVIERDEKGKPIRMVGVMLDINENKLAIKKLEESEIRFRTTFNQAVDPIFIARISEEHIPIIYDINNSVTEKIGYSRDELIGKPMSIIHTKELKIDILERVKILLSGKEINFETVQRKKDGTLIPIEISAKKIEITSTPYIYIIERDITERKNWEKDILEMQQKLLDENNNKDKFFSIISHDLKSPFGVLLSIAQLLDEEFDEMENSERKEMVMVARNSAENIYNLLEGLLEWSLASSDRLEFLPKTINLNEITNNVLLVQSQNAKNKNISILNSINSSTLVFADKKMVSTILRNLISNGIKFTPKDGKIVISSNVVENQVEVSVIDNGIGVSAQEVKKIFRIDVHHTTVGTESESGTGVGLILCKELVEKNGGKIWVESEENKGSIFKFTLPIKPKNG